MNRMVKSPVTLSDGTTLPAGTRIMVSGDKVHDNDVFPEAAQFDVARFLHLRQQQGNENKHQFVTTTAEHMGFGHGQHACPGTLRDGSQVLHQPADLLPTGRFFASNEIKIALCFLLLRYDWRSLPDGVPAEDLEFETNSAANPKLKVEIRRRKEEVDLMSPQFNVA